MYQGDPRCVWCVGGPLHGVTSRSLLARTRFAARHTASLNTVLPLTPWDVHTGAVVVIMPTLAGLLALATQGEEQADQVTPACQYRLGQGSAVHGWEVGGTVPHNASSTTSCAPELEARTCTHWTVRVAKPVPPQEAKQGDQGDICTLGGGGGRRRRRVGGGYRRCGPRLG
jgi:hypothetical protein